MSRWSLASYDTCSTNSERDIHTHTGNIIIDIIIHMTLCTLIQYLFMQILGNFCFKVYEIRRGVQLNLLLQLLSWQ